MFNIQKIEQVVTDATDGSTKVLISYIYRECYNFAEKYLVGDFFEHVYQQNSVNSQQIIPHALFTVQQEEIAHHLFVPTFQGLREINARDNLYNQERGEMWHIYYWH